MLTCAHVALAEGGGLVDVVHEPEPGGPPAVVPGEVAVALPETPPRPGEGWAAPDLALIRLQKPADHACVHLAEQPLTDHGRQSGGRSGLLLGFAGWFRSGHRLSRYDGTVTVLGRIGWGADEELRLGDDDLPDGVSGGPVFDPHRGEVVALVGANGSGKSTAVRAAIGQVPLTRGEVRLFGTPLRRFRAWSRVGYVPQRTTAAGGVPATVREVVSSGRLSRTRLGPLRKGDREAVDRALEAVGLADRAKDSVNALSGGQHQRVLIARALAGEPELLIMDEPMAGVDLASQEVLAETLRAQVDAGATVLLVLHELGPLEPLIDRAVVLRDGCVAHDGPPPKAVGQHALPGHDHVHPHAAPENADPIRTGLLD
ncbi:hypothetical protein CLM82_24130 [Streptomyces albidoflavus]|nr:hypothetical protein CLM82_24130 [Streptomyces albidoflavus]